MVLFPCAQILFFKEQMSLYAISSSCTNPRCVWLVSRFLFKRLNKSLLFILSFYFQHLMKRSNHFVRIFPYISVNYLFYPFNYPCIKGVFDSGRLKFQNNAFISNSVNSSASRHLGRDRPGYNTHTKTTAGTDEQYWV